MKFKQPAEKPAVDVGDYKSYGRREQKYDRKRGKNRVKRDRRDDRDQEDR